MRVFAMNKKDKRRSNKQAREERKLVSQRELKETQTDRLVL